MFDLIIAVLLIAFLAIALVGLGSIVLLFAFFGPPTAFAFVVAVQLSRWGCDLATSVGAGLGAFAVGVFLMSCVVRALYCSMLAIATKALARRTKTIQAPIQAAPRRRRQQADTAHRPA